MTFSIYALLGEEAPSITNESLASDLAYFFRSEKGFVLQFEQLPFAKIKTLALRWDAWLVRVSYEQGANVAQDSAEISKIVSDVGICNVADIDKRIRVVFTHDDSQEYTNQVIYVMDFLRAIPGVIIFDPQRQDLIR